MHRVGNRYPFWQLLHSNLNIPRTGRFPIGGLTCSAAQPFHVEWRKDSRLCQCRPPDWQIPFSNASVGRGTRTGRGHGSSILTVFVNVHPPLITPATWQQIPPTEAGQPLIPNLSCPTILPLLNLGDISRITKSTICVTLLQETEPVWVRQASLLSMLDPYCWD